MREALELLGKVRKRHDHASYPLDNVALVFVAEEDVPLCFESGTKHSPNTSNSLEHWAAFALYVSLWARRSKVSEGCLVSHAIAAASSRCGVAEICSLTPSAHSADLALPGPAAAHVLLNPSQMTQPRT